MRITSTAFAAVATVLLAACGRSEPEASSATADSAPTDTAAATAAGAGDPCTLVADAQATFGQPVTAEKKTMPNDTVVCEWHSADGRICGSVTPFGARWNPAAALKANFDAMVTSMGAFGEVKDQPGIGEEAKIVDGGMFGVQLAFRTKDAVALVASACKGPLDPGAMAQKLAGEIASRI